MLIVRTRFLVFGHLDAALRVVCATIKGPTPNPTSGETPIKSTHACINVFFMIRQL